MRFGLALELWSKADIHADEEDTGDTGDSDAGQAEREQAAKRAANTYPADKFRENLPTWQEVIRSGRKTADEIIAMANSKHPLTAEQMKTIRNTPVPMTK
jgi:hypothetical protein